MTITALGTLDVGVAVPGALTAVGAGIAGINGALPDIQARIDALLAFTPSPVTFAAQLALAAQITASINDAISLGLPVPSISDQIAQVAAVIAALEAQVAAVNAQLTILTGLLAPLAVAGIDAYAFDGARNALGGELGTALGGSTAHANALVLVTTDPSAWAALGVIVKVS
jgi:hypothetical protein